jgi:hypothetical protein
MNSARKRFRAAGRGFSAISICFFKQERRNENQRERERERERERDARIKQYIAFIDQICHVANHVRARDVDNAATGCAEGSERLDKRDRF